MKAAEVERHQFGFAFMRTDTGGQKVKSFWGDGDPIVAKEEARACAEAYRSSYEEELYQKACAKSRARGERYRPSRCKVQIVGCDMWK